MSKIPDKLWNGGWRETPGPLTKKIAEIAAAQDRQRDRIERRVLETLQAARVEGFVPAPYSTPDGTMGTYPNPQPYIETPNDAAEMQAYAISHIPAPYPKPEPKPQTPKPNPLHRIGPVPRKLILDRS